MSRYEDFIYAIEALSGDDRQADGFMSARPRVNATGTCGVVVGCVLPPGGVEPGREWQDGYEPDEEGLCGLVLPPPVVAAAGHYPPLGAVRLPAPEVRGRQAGWWPGQGSVVPPLPVVEAEGRVVVASRSVTPQLFVRGLTGARAGLDVARSTVLGLCGAAGWAWLAAPAVLSSSGLDRVADGAARLPAPEARAYVCSLADPIASRSAGSGAVALLRLGDPFLARLALELTDGLADPDRKALALSRAVAGRLAYRADAEGSGWGDVWSCAAATWMLGEGDCEDGAILLQALMLAAGLDPGGVLTVFGKVGSDNLGHAWTAYKRRSDRAWTVLDWTLGPPAEGAGPESLPRLAEAVAYHFVDYVLTDRAFIQVRRDTAGFFAVVAADSPRLPLFVVSGQAGRVGRAALRLFSGKGPDAAPAVFALAGAGADMTSSLPAVRGTMSRSDSRMVLAGLAGRALAGARGLAAWPRTVLSARTRYWARGASPLPRPVLFGRLGHWPTGRADLAVPGWAAAGAGLSGTRGEAWCAVAPAVSRARGLVGAHGAAGLALPLPVPVGAGFSEARGTARAALAAPTAHGRLGQPGRAQVGFYWDLETGALSVIEGYPFVSLAQLTPGAALAGAADEATPGGASRPDDPAPVLAAGPGGLFVLGGPSDDGAAIAARLAVELGAPGQGRPLAAGEVELYGRFDGAARIRLSADGAPGRTMTARPRPGDPSRLACPIGRDTRGRVWRLEIDNPDGAGFRLDEAVVNLRPLARR